MAVRKSALLGGALSLFISQAALSVGLGDIKLISALNEPLNAEIEIINPGELTDLEMLVDLATREEFLKAGVDRPFFLTNLQFEVGVNDSGKSIIYITSSKLVDEPYLDFLIELYWPSGRMLREYTVLLDLPVYTTKKPQTTSVETAKASPAKIVQKQPAKKMSPARQVQAGSDSYEVKNGDTLWGIASRSRPSGASINQAMVAIEQLNPNAFINGNVNLLKRGQILRMPADSQIANISQQQASAKMAAKTESVVEQEVIEAVAETASSSNEEKKSGRLQLSVENTADGSGNNSVLENASGVVGDGDVSSDVLENELAIANDEVARRNRDLADKNSRITQLEEQLETMQRMLEIKNNELASVQKNMGESVIEGSQSTDKVETPDVEQVKSKPVGKSPKDKDSSWTDYIYQILAGLISLIVLLFLFFRRKDKEDEDQSMATSQVPKDISTLDSMDDGVEDDVALAEAKRPHFNVVRPAVTSTSETLSDLDDMELDDEDNMFSLDDENSDSDDVFADDQEVDESPAVDFGETDNSDQNSAELSLNTSSQFLSDEDMDLDMDSSLAEIDESIEPSNEESSSDDLEIGDDLDVDLSGDVLSSDVDTEDDISIDDISFDGEEGPIEEANSAADDVDVAMSDDELDALLGEDEMSTKLDLARAFVDMGDSDGAKDILNEIIDDGDDEQKISAQALLDSLS